ncbi:hypothetical protein [Motilimonas cestriensis]|uniref:hypothetical protein n=1 Tax=Motilimonas cestriensis TaxID=2742685 RepID=UPI003DA5C481
MNKTFTLSSIISCLLLGNAAIAQPICEANFEPTSNPDDRFETQELSTNAGMIKVINDRATGLQWAYCPYGQTPSADLASCEGEAQPIGTMRDKNKHQLLEDTLTQENARLGESAHLWRAPNTHELMSIFNGKCTPAIYHAFSFEINKTDEEIQAMIDTRVNWWDPKVTEAERNFADDQRMKGNAYRYLPFTTDTSAKVASDGYQTVIFSNAYSVTSTVNTWPGLLRLVRSIPVQ